MGKQGESAGHWLAQMRASHLVTDAVRRCLLSCITACPLVRSSSTKPCQFSSVRRSERTL